MDQGQQWITLAHILRPQGRKGEVLAELLTDFPARFAQHPRVWLAPDGLSQNAAALSRMPPRPIQIVSHWLPVGRNAGRVVLQFQGIRSIAQAETLSGLDLVIPLAERLPLQDGAVYVSDLIGSTVYDRQTALGVVESVHFAATPDGSRRLEDAAPLLAIASPDGDELLIPFAKSYVTAIDIAAKTLHMALPEGLADLNRRAPRIAPQKR